MEVPAPSVPQPEGGRKEVIKIIWGKEGLVVSARSVMGNQKCLPMSPGEHHFYCSH